MGSQTSTEDLSSTQPFITVHRSAEKFGLEQRKIKETSTPQVSMDDHDDYRKDGYSLDLFEKRSSFSAKIIPSLADETFESDENTLRKMFNKLDSDRDNLVTAQDVIKVIQDHFSKKFNPVLVNSIKKTIKRSSKSKKNYWTFEDFKAFFEEEPSFVRA